MTDSEDDSEVPTGLSGETTEDQRSFCTTMLISEIRLQRRVGVSGLVGEL